MKKQLTYVVFGFIIGSLILGLFYKQSADAAITGTNYFVSKNSSGANGLNKSVYEASIASDGNSVVFRTDATNVVAGSTNTSYALFLRNLATSTTSRVDVSSAGVQANGYAYGNPGISRTGRYVAFVSFATNLIDGKSTRLGEVYVRDTVTNTTSLVTKTTSGADGLCNVIRPQVSSDGRFILFVGYCSNLGPTLSSSNNYIYIADRQLGTFSVINSASGGAPVNWNVPFRMSCDGTIVVLESLSKLTPDDTDANRDIYLADLRNGQIIRNLSSVTTSASTSTSNPSISCNGDYISFSSDDYMLDPTHVSSTDTHLHAYVYNRLDDTYALADQTSSGIVANDSVGIDIGASAVDDKGNVAFISSATNLSSAITNYPFPDKNQVWLRSSGTTRLLSVNSAGDAADYGVAGGTNFGYLSISTDGKVVSYITPSSNLSGSDTNNLRDVIASLTDL